VNTASAQPNSSNRNGPEDECWTRKSLRSRRGDIDYVEIEHALTAFEREQNLQSLRERTDRNMIDG
jgi:hypothetical protein